MNHRTATNEQNGYDTSEWNFTNYKLKLLKKGIFQNLVSSQGSLGKKRLKRARF